VVSESSDFRSTRNSGKSELHNQWADNTGKPPEGSVWKYSVGYQLRSATGEIFSQLVVVAWQTCIVGQVAAGNKKSHSFSGPCEKDSVLVQYEALIIRAVDSIP
jgi:hypothetical protein